MGKIVDTCLNAMPDDDTEVFLKPSTLAHIGDAVTKFYTLEQLAGSIARAFDQPI